MLCCIAAVAVAVPQHKNVRAYSIVRAVRAVRCGAGQGRAGQVQDRTGTVRAPRITPRGQTNEGGTMLGRQLNGHKGELRSSSSLVSS